MILSIFIKYYLSCLQEGSRVSERDVRVFMKKIMKIKLQRELCKDRDILCLILWRGVELSIAPMIVFENYKICGKENVVMVLKRIKTWNT